MDDFEDQKEVRFDIYCPTCLYCDEDEDCTECAECLQHPTNTYSQKPIRYVKKK